MASDHHSSEQHARGRDVHETTATRSCSPRHQPRINTAAYKHTDNTWQARAQDLWDNRQEVVVDQVVERHSNARRNHMPPDNVPRLQEPSQARGLRRQTAGF
eukprot:139149-Rhodomonas_salina.1